MAAKGAFFRYWVFGLGTSYVGWVVVLGGLLESTRKMDRDLL